MRPIRSRSYWSLDLAVNVSRLACILENFIGVCRNE